MKKILILIILICAITSLEAQSVNKDQTSSPPYSLLAKYPYKDVQSFLGNPDTMLFCHYVLGGYNEKNMPISINLFLYRRDGEWWGTTLVKYCYKKRDQWDLTKPKWILTDLSPKFNAAIVELNNIDYGGYDISIIHTWIYIKQGNVLIKELIGNYRDFAKIAPEFSYVFMVAFLESYNQEIIKTYKKYDKRYRMAYLVHNVLGRKK